MVGRTGSGKSTLVKLLWRYLHPEKGQILIDGVDINSFDLKDLRRGLNIISQDINLFKSTLLRNIDLVGNSILDEAQKEKTKKILERLGFNNQQYLQNGLEMLIESDGSNLSFGEKQIICLARSLMHSSKLILFDEATAKIDIKTEERFQEVVNEEYKDSTMFIVAHRIQTVKDCDEIIVMDAGEIIERGSYQNLI